MTVIVSHPTGNPCLRAVLRALEKNGLLAQYWTTLALPGELAELTWLKNGVQRRLSQRHFGEAPWSKTKSRPWREAIRLAALGARIESLTAHEAGWASVDGVYRDLDRAVAKRLRTDREPWRAVYAYEDGALESFKAAHETGRLAIYDLPITHWRTLRCLLEEEAERLPEWACTMEGLRDSAEKHARKDAEIEFADHIIVASSFTRDSLSGIAGDRPVHVTPFGCPPPALTRPAGREASAPLQLLYAGHLAQRKGIADLISAVGMLEIDWHLTLAGPRPAKVPASLDRFLSDPRVTWLGAIPHATLMEEMARAHVFVFPSIAEGFGMVITEAMAAGLPVITTPHTAGPDILDEGIDGFIVPIRDPAVLADRITRLAEDETQRQEMAHAAKAKAAEMSWMRYETQIGDLVTEWLDAR
ncbi:glycosyltransferase family 4 protein [Erythrobacter sp. HL-111]|uniref:glycosyltransferase family 4 protein n=1 Tax=Erythrobacter sp. HL-111 TaxID=1798193 RepID=UPI00087A10F3|nr:glycosyltransferase family 4 protein [Erythrobacter sp. HL-111]SDS66501.1 Glycosyltransferase involved in cell wall bisynthesis [Erythrobacter sp. HL-111]